MMRIVTALALGLAGMLIGCTAAAPEPTAEPTPPPTALPTVAPAATPTVRLAETPASAQATNTLAAPADTPTVRPTATAAGVFITFQDFEILPAETTVRAGTQVIFLIKGAAGSLHQPYNFDAPNTFESPPNLGDGATYAFTFNEPGTVTLRCGYHPNMVATLVVAP